MGRLVRQSSSGTKRSRSSGQSTHRGRVHLAGRPEVHQTASFGPARDTLLVGLADYALANGITDYTGVAELAWFEQVRTFGWDCVALGLPREHGGRMLTALHIAVDDTTTGKLADRGIASDAAIGLLPARAA